MRLVFNYDNVIVSCFYDDMAACIHRSREYAVRGGTEPTKQPLVNK